MPCPTMIAIVISWESPGAMLKGPVESCNLLSAGLDSSHPVFVTGSPGTWKRVGWSVTWSMIGVPSAFSPCM